MPASNSEVQARLAVLFQQLARLDRERAALTEDIARSLGDLSLAVSSQKAAAARTDDEPPAAAPPAAGPPRWRPITLRDQLMELIHSGPHVVWTAWDLATRLNVGTSELEMRNIRTLLARMKKDGHIRRIGHGRYQAH